MEKKTLLVLGWLINAVCYVNADYDPNILNPSDKITLSDFPSRFIDAVVKTINGNMSFFRGSTGTYVFILIIAAFILGILILVKKHLGDN